MRQFRVHSYRTTRTIYGGSVSILLPLLLTLTGCGSLASPPPPTARPVANRVPVAPPDTRYDRLVGTLLAVEDLVGQADSLITSSLAAQSAQLSDSAKQDLADARRQIDGARILLREAGTPSRYGHARSLLSASAHWYSLAVASARSRPDRSQVDANHGHSLLMQAASLLDPSPEAGRLDTIAAKAAALDRVSRMGTQRRRPVRKPVVSHPSQPTRRAVPPTATPHPTATSWPTATPRPKRRLTRTRTQRPRPTPTPTATRVTLPTRIAAPVKRPTRKPALLVLSRSLRGAVGDVTSASTRVQRCQGYLTSLGSGNDPLGSVKIVGCIDRATHRLLHLVNRLGPDLHRSRSAMVEALVGGAYRSAVQAQTQLKRARTDVQAVRLDAAQSELSAAASDLRSAQSALAQAQRHLL